MTIPLLINISATIAFLGGMMLPYRWMMIAWGYAVAAIAFINRYYPKYWEYIGSLTVN